MAGWDYREPVPPLVSRFHTIFPDVSALLHVSFIILHKNRARNRNTNTQGELNSAERVLRAPVVHGLSVWYIQLALRPQMKRIDNANDMRPSETDRRVPEGARTQTK